MFLSIICGKQMFNILEVAATKRNVTFTAPDNVTGRYIGGVEKSLFDISS